MYCNRCGSLMNPNGNFCSVCGQSSKQTTAFNNKLLDFSKYLMVATSPLILILRMLLQEETIGFGWSGEYTYYSIPGRFRVVMAVIAFGMLSTSLYLKSKSGMKSKFVVAGCIFSAFISYLITFVD